MTTGRSLDVVFLGAMGLSFLVVRCRASLSRVRTAPALQRLRLQVIPSHTPQ